MTITLTIPKEFEDHFNADRFKDSLNRLAADAHLLAGLYERELALMLIEVFAQAEVEPVVNVYQIYEDALNKRDIFLQGEWNG